MKGVVPFDVTFGTGRHHFVLPVDEADVLALAASRTDGSGIAAWATARSPHVRRAADPRILLRLFDTMFAALEAAGVGSPPTLDALRRARDTALGPSCGLAISRWIERLRGLAEIRAPRAFLDYEVAALPSQPSPDPTAEAGIRWESSPPITTIGPALQASVAWEVGTLGFRGITSECGIDALAQAGPVWDMPLFSADDMNQTFELPPGATLGSAVLVPNTSLLAWSERVMALPDRLPIDVSHVRAREVVRAWQADQGRQPDWFLAHPDRGNPHAVPLMAITLRAQWSDAWAERRAALCARLRELAPFGFGMLSFEGRYLPHRAAPRR